MKSIKCTVGKLWVASCAAWPVLSAHAQIDVHINLPSVEIKAPAVAVEAAVPGAITIQSDTDFEAPLTAYGRWEMVEGVRCWVPTQVEADWRPYSKGHWERTDAGWYWASDEPWGWATFHYGRWAYREGGGWYWSPGVHWAPAWVAWRNGGGYAGWAPLPPAAKFEVGVGIHFDVNLLPPRSFCFVQEGHFTDPIRPTTVIVNNTTIINKTVNITSVRTRNNTIINEGPPVARIEQATGHRVQVVKATELRQHMESKVTVKPAENRNNREVKGDERRAPAREGADVAKREQNRNAERPRTETERAEKQTDEAKETSKTPKTRTPPKKPTPGETEKGNRPQHEKPEEKPQQP